MSNDRGKKDQSGTRTGAIKSNSGGQKRGGKKKGKKRKSGLIQGGSEEGNEEGSKSGGCGLVCPQEGEVCCCCCVFRCGCVGIIPRSARRSVFGYSGGEEGGCMHFLTPGRMGTAKGRNPMAASIPMEPALNQQNLERGLLDQNWGPCPGSCLQEASFPSAQTREGGGCSSSSSSTPALRGQ